MTKRYWMVPISKTLSLPPRAIFPARCSAFLELGMSDQISAWGSRLVR